MKSLNRAINEHDIKEASAWFSRLNTQSVSAETLEGFREWRRDPRNRTAYAEVERAWKRMGTLREDPSIASLIAEAANRRSQRAPSTIWAWREYALTSLVALLAAALGIQVATNSGLFGKSYSTEVGEDRLIELADGSKIRLDTSTQIAVTFSAHQRLVRLIHGQALFEVAHDARRPFIVAAGTTDIRAVGTKFDVRQDADVVRVTLVQGKIEVFEPAHPKAAPIVMVSGEQLVANGKPSKPVAVDVAAATSWSDGRVLFHAIPLQQAIAEMNRYSRKTIVLTAPDLGREVVSGAFDTSNIDGFIAAVSELHGLRAEVANGEILLARQKP